MKKETENWINVAERLYYFKNPDTKMNVPSTVYETVNKWRNEWLNIETDLNLFDWCIKNKQ